MAIIDPEGLFNGDRLRRCSNAAQLHWPRLYCAANGFARLEINYPKIIGTAYSTFDPLPSPAELEVYVREYADNFLLFLYEFEGRLWGQFDTRPELLPRYKTARDRRSPIPPEPMFSEWRKAYRSDSKAVPKDFGNISETFHAGVHGVGVGIGVGKTLCASKGDARLGDSISDVDDPPFGTTEQLASLPAEAIHRQKPSSELTAERECWFTTWWAEYWLHKAKKATRDAFLKHVRTKEKFQQVMTATRAQKPEMLTREPSKRPHGATWLNGERWEDETTSQTPDGLLYTLAEDE